MKYSVVYAIVYTPYSCVLQKYHTRFLVVYTVVYSFNFKAKCKIFFVTPLRRVCILLYTHPIVECCKNVTVADLP